MGDQAEARAARRDYICVFCCKAFPKECFLQKHAETVHDTDRCGCVIIRTVMHLACACLPILSPTLPSRAAHGGRGAHKAGKASVQCHEIHCAC